MFSCYRILVLCFIFLSSFRLQAQITSNFSSTDEGWKVLDGNTGATTTPTYNATGGNPGGNISYGTLAINANIYFVAPAKFNGNQSLSYNQNLSFDLLVSNAGADNSQSDIVISSPAINLIYQMPTKPSTGTWNSYSILLNETAANWHVGSYLGTAPTKTQMKQALSNVTSIQIRLKYLTFNTFTYTSQLDNVVLNQVTIPSSPTISSFSPASGLPGTTVTITGTNFNSTVAQNTVYFNGAKATVVNASATKLTVKSPSKISYGPITVINTTNGTQATSRTNFNPLFDNNKDFGGRIIASSFGKSVSIGTPPSFQVGTTGFSIGDLDGDGWQDVLTSRTDAGNMYAQIHRNAQQTSGISAASFAAPVTLSLPNSPAGLTVGRVGQTAIADMDGDGKLDVIVNVGYNSGNYDNTFIIFLNQSTAGNLSFASPYIFQIADAQNNNEGIAVADMDGDGRPDILTAFQNSACQLTILQNLSSPGNLDFAYPQNFAQGVTMGIDISLGDLNGDNKPEVLVQAYLNSAINVYENNSTIGSISLGVPFKLNSNTTANIKVADVDNDGKNDIFFRDYGAGGPILLKKNNHSTGALTAADFGADITLTQQAGGGLGSPYSYTTAADLNGDNKLDIIAADGTNIAVYQNNFVSGAISASSFYAGTTFEGGNNSNQYILTADIDGDNKPEILIRPQLGAAFWVYHNENFPAPQVSSVLPSGGNAGTAVTLTGINFNTSTSSNVPQVRMGGIVTTGTSLTNTSVNTTLPLGVVSPRAQVTEHGLVGFSKPYSTTFNGAQVINATSFSLAADLPMVGNGNYGLVVADFDDDGKPDIVANDNFSPTRVFQNVLPSAGANLTNTSFSLASSLASTTISMAAGDFNGDGKIDLVAPNNLFRNNSAALPSFAASVGINLQNANGIISNHDFNLDGKPDLASLNNAQIWVFENLTRNGAFTYASTFESFATSGVPPTQLTVTGTTSTSATSFGHSMESFDADGDGFDDLLLGITSTTSSLTVYPNSGQKGAITASQFSAPITFASNGTPSRIASADFDGDGKIDVALSYNSGSVISIFKNQSTVGAISFAAKQDITAGAGIYDMVTRDLDGDGKPEIITTNYVAGVSTSFSVFKNTSAGSISFTAPVTFSLTSGRVPYNLEVADFNLDGKPDIVIRGSGSTTNFVSVFQNNIPTVSITVDTQPSPSTVCDGVSAQFTTSASGTTNITYQWQYSSDGVVPFADVTNTGGYLNVTTSALTINSAGNFGAGVYRCKISGDFAASVFTNTVSFTVNALPAAPSATDGNDCGPGSVTLVASGGSNGQYIWYDQNGVIAGQINNTYVTPVIAATTQYSVAITNGTCVSTKTNVQAVILTVGCATINITAQPSDFIACAGDIATFSATVTGTTNITYQWQFSSDNGVTFSDVTNGGGYSNVTTSTLSVNTTGNFGVGRYRCKINGDFATTVFTNDEGLFINSNNCAKPVITAEQLATQIGGKVIVDLKPLITTANLDLTSLQIISPPSSGATASIDANGILTIDYAGKAFAGQENITIKACDQNGQCSTQDFNIDVAGDIIVYNGISPNGANPKLVLQYIEILPDTKNNSVYIFDRWENLVWHGDNYNNDSVVFTGLNDGGSSLPSGVYFYKIDFASGKKSKTGFISLRRQ